MKNTYKRNFLISLALVIVGSGMLIYSGARAFSYEANTAYTEFYFTGDFGVGDADLPIFNVDGTDGGATGEFSFGLKNLSTTEVLSGKFSFVDAVTLIAGTNVYGCKGEKDSTFFSSDITVSPNPFVLNTGSTATYTANFDFNQKVSGTYTGCVVYTPDGTIQDGVADAVPRKALIFAVNLTGTNPSHPVSIIVNPGSRWDGESNGHLNGFLSTGKILFYKQNDHVNPVYSGFIAVNNEGLGIGDLVVNNGVYDVVYKGWHHLSTYITGVYFDGQSISFVTGYNIIGGKEQSSMVYNSGIIYQYAGDMIRKELYSDTGLLIHGYDYDQKIDTTDLSVLYDTTLCPYGPNFVGYGNPCDLNNDGYVNSTDAGVIISNVNVEDAAFKLGDFGNFGVMYQGIYLQ